MASSRERENRWRLEQLVHACELRLQELIKDAFSVRHRGVAWRDGAALTSEYPALLRSLAPLQRGALTNGAAATWDVTLCHAVLTHLRALGSRADAAAVAAIVAARNQCAHAAQGCLDTAVFDQHFASCADAFTVLDGDPATLEVIRTCAIDASDVRVLPSSQEATQAAENAKMEGNRCFREGDFVAAKRCYTNGTLVTGAVDTMVLAQLYSNRAMANMKLNDLAGAKQDAKRAIELAPQWAKPHVRLAEIYAKVYKNNKALARLEMALGLAEAAADRDAVKDIRARVAEYRLLRDEDQRRESENLAYGPGYTSQGTAFLAANLASQGLTPGQDPNAMVDKLIAALSSCGPGVMTGERHVLMGHRANQDGRLADAAREFMAAAVAGNAEGMYNYSIMQLKGRGTRKNIKEAVQWLEKAAASPVSRHNHLNVGIGEALATLGSFYGQGIHVQQASDTAYEYWKRAAELGAPAGCNQLGLCYLHGTHGVGKDLARARELFRQSAELLHNEAMSNLGFLHASLLEYDSAARWADTACTFGFLPAAETAKEYRRKAALKATVSPKVAGAVDRFQKFLVDGMSLFSKPTHERQNEAPTVKELEAIDTPYGKRLLAAKTMMMQAMGLSVQMIMYKDPTLFEEVLRLAANAHRIDDGTLVFTNDESHLTRVLATLGQELGAPLSSDMALMLQPPDPAAFVTFWKSMQLQFPQDLELTKRAACAYMFTGYAGSDANRGLQLFQHAFSLLPCPDDDSHPQTMALLYEVAVAYHQSQQYDRAEALFTRFLKHAEKDGHRKAAEAHFICGFIELVKTIRGQETVGKRRKKGKKPKSANITIDITAARRHWEKGIELLDDIPGFLRGAAEQSPNRRLLEQMLEIPTMLAGSNALELEAPQFGPKRGGELVPGRRRHPDLRSNESMQRSMWRKSIAAMSELVYTSKRNMSSTTKPPPIRSTSDAFNGPATIDELFSSLKDCEYVGCVLDSIVVSVPSFNGSSFHFVVEDSQREPARIAVYNAPPMLIQNLLPGTVLQLVDPYVRIASDRSVMLRVDDPVATIKVQSKHEICWVCAVQQQPNQALKSCAKCHVAVYCSKKCQKHDWNVDGHRFLCATFRA